LMWLFCLGIDTEADLCLDMTARGKFTHKTMMEQVEFLKALHSRTHFFHHKNQTPLGKSHVECGGVLISRNQTYTIPIFDLWASTRITNTEGNNASSFRVSYWIKGLWQYLKDITAQKAYKRSFP
jgi:hypothetical protein